MSESEKSTVLTIRVPADLDRRIARAARKRRSTKSAVLREAIASAFGETPKPADPVRQARRQSVLVGGRASERDTLDFIDRVADGKGWQ